MNRQSSTRNIKIPIQLHTQLKIQAASENRKLQEVTEEALNEYLKIRLLTDEVIELQK